MKYIIAIVAGILVIGLYLQWTTERDQKVQESAQRYEECVKKEYGGRTPHEVRETTGEYPVCDINKTAE